MSLVKVSGSADAVDEINDDDDDNDADDIALLCTDAIANKFRAAEICMQVGLFEDAASRRSLGVKSCNLLATLPRSKLQGLDRILAGSTPVPGLL